MTFVRDPLTPDRGLLDRDRLPHVTGTTTGWIQADAARPGGLYLAAVLRDADGVSRTVELVVPDRLAAQLVADMLAATRHAPELARQVDERLAGHARGATIP